MRYDIFTFLLDGFLIARIWEGNLSGKPKDAFRFTIEPCQEHPEAVTVATIENGVMFDATGNTAGSFHVEGSGLWSFNRYNSTELIRTGKKSLSKAQIHVFKLLYPNFKINMENKDVHV